MKGLFNDENANLIIGREGEELVIEIMMTPNNELVKAGRKIYIPSNQLPDLQNFIHKMVIEIEDEQRKKLPFWKRLW